MTNHDKVGKEKSGVLFQRGSSQASEGATSELRLEDREFRKSVPGGGKSIALPVMVLSRNEE